MQPQIRVACVAVMMMLMRMMMVLVMRVASMIENAVNEFPELQPKPTCIFKLGKRILELFQLCFRGKLSSRSSQLSPSVFSKAC